MRAGKGETAIVAGCHNVRWLKIIRMSNYNLIPSPSAPPCSANFTVPRCRLGPNIKNQDKKLKTEISSFMAKLIVKVDFLHFRNHVGKRW